MAVNAELSDITAADALAGGELIYVVQGGNSRRAALGAIGAQLIEDATAADARTTIGLGSAAVQDTGAFLSDSGAFLADSGAFLSDTIITTLGRSLLDDTGQTAFLTTLGFGAAGRSIAFDATAADVRDFLDVAAYVADRTALSALDTSKETVAFLRENGREGIFEFDSSNLSTSVTNDAQEGLHVAPSSDATGASGAWVRRFSTGFFLNVKWFGATGDGTTNDTTAIQAAIDYAESLISTFAVGGLAIFFPRGTYLINAQLTVAANHIVLKGEGKESSIINASSPTFTYVSFDKSGSSLHGGGIVDMGFQAGGNATAGAMIRMDDVVDGYIQNVILRGWWNGIDLVGANRTRLTNIEAHQGTRSSGSGNDAIRLLGDAVAGVCSDIHMTDLQLVGQGFTYQASLKIVGVDGLYVQNSHFIEGVRGVHCLPSDDTGNSTVASIHFTNCYFDTATTNHVFFAGSASTAYRSFNFVNCTFRDAGSVSLLSAPVTQATDLVLVGCNFRQNDGRAIYFSNGNLDQAVISGCIFDGNNVGDTGTSGDVRLDGGSNIVLTGCVFAGGGAHGKAVDINSSVDGVVFSQCDMVASTAGTKVENTGSNVKINSIRGYTLRNSGEAVIQTAATSVTVNHGLDATPSASDVRITLRTDAPGVTRAWVDTVGATSFRIAVNAAPTDTGTWAWSVDMER